jgi:hypothetical protein
MLGPFDAIESARVALFAVTPLLDQPVPLALIENVRATRQIRSQNVPAIGVPVPPTNVSNMEEGQIAWARAYHLAPEVARAIAPEIRDWLRFRAFNLQGLDAEDGSLLWIAFGVRPTMLDFESRAGIYVRQSYAAICRFILFGHEAQAGV